MFNKNTNPNMMAITPTRTFSASSPLNINVIPKTNKLSPRVKDTAAVLKIGKIIKINPKIMDIIPYILLDSMFFLQNFVFFFYFSSVKLINSKAMSFSYIIIFFILFECWQKLCFSVFSNNIWKYNYKNNLTNT